MQEKSMQQPPKLPRRKRKPFDKQAFLKAAEKVEKAFQKEAESKKK